MCVCVCVCWAFKTRPPPSVKLWSVGSAALIWEQVGEQGTNCRRCPALHIAAFINRPKDVSGCPAAPEEFSFTALLASFLFSRFSLCVFVCVCVYVCVTGTHPTQPNQPPSHSAFIPPPRLAHCRSTMTPPDHWFADPNLCGNSLWGQREGGPEVTNSVCLRPG